MNLLQGLTALLLVSESHLSAWASQGKLMSESMIERKGWGFVWPFILS